MDATTQREMPRYQCHKKVWALKIKEVVFDWMLAAKENRESDGSAMITPVEEGYAPFKVDREYVNKHLLSLQSDVMLGGYYVVYEDGYKSFSPAKAFEEGYMLWYK